MERCISCLINVSYILEQRLLSFPAFWTQMIEIFRFSGQIMCVRAEPGILWQAPVALFSRTFFPAAPPGHRKRIMHTHLGLSLEKPVYCDRKEHTKYTRNGFLHSSPSHQIPMRQGRNSHHGITRAVCTSAVPRSRQGRPAVHRVRSFPRAR